MKRKPLTLTLILALLCSAVAGAHLVNLGSANPYFERGSVAPDTATKPSKITVFSPLNGSVYTKFPIILSINVTLPESRTALGTILYYVTCRSDWQENESYLYVNKGYDNSVESQIPGLKHQYFQDSQNLTDIPDGNHNLTITAVAGGFYPADNMGFYRFMINDSLSVFFTTNALPPNISVLSIENKTYPTSNIALNFTVNEQVSEITYSLDGQRNVTIIGNTTLLGLPNGDHNLTVYATDLAGNFGASETIAFSIAEPFPTTLFAVASAVSVAFAGLGMLLYFKKRKRQ